MTNEAQDAKAESAEIAFSYDSLAQHMQRVKRTVIVSADERARLLRIIAEANVSGYACPARRIREARQRLIEGYQALVVRLAKRLHRPGMLLDLMDLIQEGNVGLLRAVDGYDGQADGATFHGYAIAWIRGTMLVALQHGNAPVRVPNSTVMAIWRLARMEGELELRLGRAPSLDELAEAMGVSVTKVCELLLVREAQQPGTSLDEVHPSVRDGEDAYQWGELLEAPSLLLGRCGVEAQVHDFIDALPTGERAVMRLRYGYEDGQGHSVRQVTQRLGVSRWQVEQIDAKVKRQMRALFVRQVAPVAAAIA